MKPLLLTTLVDRRYWDYVELFTWCAKKSYPEYDVKVLRKEDVFPNHPDLGFTTNALRFLVPPQYYDGYQYVYVTDIDMLILREVPPLLEFHLMDMTGPYSNSLRHESNKFACDEERWNGSQSLTGLHFFHRDWLALVEPLAVVYRKILEQKAVGRGYDGHMLWSMCQQLGLSLPGKKSLVGRHHGIHLGSFRLYRPHEKAPDSRWALSEREVIAKLNKRVGPWVSAWNEYREDPQYGAIVGRLGHDTTAYQMLQRLTMYCRGDNQWLKSSTETD